MRVKNFQENVVYGTLTTILESQYPDLVSNETIRNDIAAFVLNKLPPRYITSERGYTRFVGAMLYKPDQKDIIKIITLINHAIEIVLTRRKEPETQESTARDISFDSNSSFLRFPVIVGTVRDQKTKQPIEGTTISLYDKGNKIVGMGSKRWRNPTTTQKETFAYFSLWPQSIINPNGSNSNEYENYNFHLSATHASYKEYTSKITIAAQCCFNSLNEFNFDNFHDVGEVLLVKS